MSGLLSPTPWRRLHQLSGTSGNRPSWSLGSQLNFKFSDVPQRVTVLQRPLATYMPFVRLNFSGSIVSTGGCVIPRKVFTPMLVSSVQVQGTEIGTPVSSSHMNGGLLDTDSYIRRGMRNGPSNRPGITLAANTAKTFNYTVDVYFANLSQRKGWETSPLALFMTPGEILINTPATLAGVSATLADVTISNMVVTASAALIGDTRILIANPWQMTKHKANAGNGADSVQINSFGAASTLTGVQSKCGLHAVLWAGSGLIGSTVAGPGTVASITQFAADFLGIRQTNDPRAVLQQMFDDVSNGEVNDFGDGSGAHDTNNAIYPLFDLATPTSGNLDLATNAEFFPVMYPVRDFDASKLFEAVGNPSYDLTGTFTPGGSHYTIVEGCYPFTLDKLNDLVAVIQRSHLGNELFGTDDLQLNTKMADNSDPAMYANAANAQKLVFLPRIVQPRQNAAVK